jgi:hypothetical protein
MTRSDEYDGDRIPSFPHLASSPDSPKVFALSFQGSEHKLDRTPPTMTFTHSPAPSQARDPDTLIRENEMLRTQEQEMRVQRDERIAENMRLKTQLDECRAKFRAMFCSPDNTPPGGKETE